MNLKSNAQTSYQLATELWAAIKPNLRAWGPFGAVVNGQQLFLVTDEVRLNLLRADEHGLAECYIEQLICGTA